MEKLGSGGGVLHLTPDLGSAVSQRRDINRQTPLKTKRRPDPVGECYLI